MRAQRNHEMRDTILRAWYEYYQASGIGPSYKELMTLTEIGSTSTIHRYISMLAEADLIRYQPGKPRTVTLTTAGREYLEGMVVHD
ncbi:hypothetical protein KBP51_06295 [Lactiplantibacillus pentosus]|uniref:hypothetical protein n=1 Tax=Lactiplantibacillus pentosus TaxID=1589 RepID=UPI00132FFF38|nr:hypothetical protein [Lactiplantibacillus pentosus]MBQ0836077.1 hypothetical protein [Lactiplantibacillus pentosus]